MKAEVEEKFEVFRKVFRSLTEVCNFDFLSFPFSERFSGVTTVWSWKNEALKLVR